MSQSSSRSPSPSRPHTLTSSTEVLAPTQAELDNLRKSFAQMDPMTAGVNAPWTSTWHHDLRYKRSLTNPSPIGSTSNNNLDDVTSKRSVTEPGEGLPTQKEPTSISDQIEVLKNMHDTAKQLHIVEPHLTEIRAASSSVAPQPRSKVFETSLDRETPVADPLSPPSPVFIIRRREVSTSPKNPERPWIPPQIDSRSGNMEPISYEGAQRQVPRMRLARGRKLALIPEQRSEAVALRKLGSCLNCKKRRAKCDLGTPCQSCIKHYKGDMDKYPCIRNTEDLSKQALDNADERKEHLVRRRSVERCPGCDERWNEQTLDSGSDQSPNQNAGMQVLQETADAAYSGWKIRHSHCNEEHSIATWMMKAHTQDSVSSSSAANFLAPIPNDEPGGESIDRVVFEDAMQFVAQNEDNDSKLKIGSVTVPTAPQADIIVDVKSSASPTASYFRQNRYSKIWIKLAHAELLKIFQENEQLKSLYQAAVQSHDIGPNKLRRKVQQLLKEYMGNLCTEACDEFERWAVNLVFLNISPIAYSIVTKLEVSTSVGSALKSHTAVESADDTKGDGEVQGDSVGGHLIDGLRKFRRFLVRGDPIANYKKELEAFVSSALLKRSNAPKEISIEEEAPEAHTCVSSEQVVVDNVENHSVREFHYGIWRRLALLFVAMGYLEPSLDIGWVRLRWQCKCGDRFFGDVKEYRVGGVRELVDRMNRSTGAKVTIHTYSKTSSNQHWSLKAPAWARRFTNISFSGTSKAPNPSGSLPRHDSRHKAPSTSSAASVSHVTTPSGPTLHLLACAHRNQRRKCLLQDPIDAVTTDQALFRFMKQQLKRNRSYIRSLLAMRNIQGMFFVKFRLRMGTTVEVRDHNPCCTSSQPGSCECIPPAPKVEPSPGAEYRCTPAGPLAVWPPVLSQDLMHMLSSPQCINEQETWVLDQLPKRTCGKLLERTGPPAEGWGIYYQEGLDVDMIIGVVFCIFVLASLLFGVLWTVLKMDVQGAFGVSSYMVTASGVFLAWIASRAKNFG